MKTFLFGLDLNDFRATPFILPRRLLQQDANVSRPSNRPVHSSCSGTTKKAPQFWGICRV